MKPIIKHVAYVPKTKEDLEFIYNKMNQYFPMPYLSIVGFINMCKSYLNVNLLVATSYMERPLEIRWALPEREVYQEVHTVEEFYEELKQLKLIAIL